MMAGSSLCSLAFLLQTGALCPVDLVESIYDRIDREDMDGVFVTLTRRTRTGRGPCGKAAPARGALARIARWHSDRLERPVRHACLGDDSRLDRARGPAKGTDGCRCWWPRWPMPAMVSIGRTNMSEFAFSGLGINPHYGTPINPHSIDEPLIPGGSSSGSGVAVATGCFRWPWAAIQVDRCASGRLDRYRRLQGDARPLFDARRVSSGHQPGFPGAADAHRARHRDDRRRPSRLSPGPAGALHEHDALVVPTNIVFDNCDSAVIKAFDAAIERIAASGIPVERGTCAAFRPFSS